MPNPAPPTPAKATIKHKLRAHLRAKRQALSAADRAALDARICGQLLSTVLETDRPSQAIAMFISHGGEPDLSALADRLVESNRSVYCPVLDGQTLRFHRYHPGVAMTPNRYGIPEPVDQPSVAVGALDWVLMPLVGFSATGTRLGMGGGFYDRTLAELDRRSPIKAGVAYSIQQVDALPSDAWDVSMDVVVTDRGALWVE